MTSEEKMVYEEVKGGFLRPNKKTARVGYEHIVVNIREQILSCKACGKKIILEKDDKGFNNVLEAFIKNHKGCKITHCAFCKAGVKKNEK